MTSFSSAFCTCSDPFQGVRLPPFFTKLIPTCPLFISLSSPILQRPVSTSVLACGTMSCCFSSPTRSQSAGSLPWPRCGSWKMPGVSHLFPHMCVWRLLLAVSAHMETYQRACSESPAPSCSLILTLSPSGFFAKALATI